AAVIVAAVVVVAVVVPVAVPAAGAAVVARRVAVAERAGIGPAVAPVGPALLRRSRLGGALLRPRLRPRLPTVAVNRSLLPCLIRVTGFRKSGRSNERRQCQPDCQLRSQLVVLTHLVPPGRGNCWPCHSQAAGQQTSHPWGTTGIS